MVELEVWYDQAPDNDYSDGDPALIVRTAAEFNALIDRVLAETRGHRCPPMIEVSIKGRQLPVLEVGLGQERGFITFHSNEGGTTKGEGDPELYVEYVQGGNLSEVPASVEVDIHLVRRGLLEFLESGERPSVVQRL